jgi:c-di-GMP-related signal transduction protein
VNVYLARQPIFDRRQKVIAYELLYRAGEENYNPEQDGIRATTEVISSALLDFGLEKVARGKRIFIKFSWKLIIDETAFLLPKEQVAIEITLDTEPDRQMIDACRHLHKEGYTLVLDGFDQRLKGGELLAFVDIVKVNFQTTGAAERGQVAAFLKESGKKLLAKKVETVRDFETAMEYGFDYCQGYFFCEPVVIKGRELSTTKMQNLRLMQEVYKPEIDMDRMEKIISQDPSLSYKLLRFINSPAFAMRFPISSIRQAVALLGQKELVKWVSLVALRNVGYDKPDELIVVAVSRAKFCEMMAQRSRLKDRSAELFLTGLFSLLDVFLGQPMEEVLTDLPLTEEVKQALRGEEGDYGKLLNLVLLYEKGNFDQALTIAINDYQLEPVQAMLCYLDALELADMAWK